MSGFFSFVNMDDPRESLDAVVGELSFRLPEGSEFVNLS